MQLIMKANLGIVDKLLITAFELENTGKIHFSAEDLVVAAWGLFPDAFGLRGYTDTSGKAIYPDSNRVYVEIMGSKPLRKKGFIKKVGEKLYQLTEAGRDRARSIYKTAPHAKEKSPQKWTLARETTHELVQLLESRAAKKFRSGNKDDVTFYDACGFWGISPRSNAKELWSNFSHIEEVLGSALRNLGSTKFASARHGGLAYTSDAIKILQQIHEMMQGKFEEELGFIKQRIDERK